MSGTVLKRIVPLTGLNHFLFSFASEFVCPWKETVDDKWVGHGHCAPALGDEGHGKRQPPAEMKNKTKVPKALTACNFLIQYALSLRNSRLFVF